jgi:hypothetical protein
MSILVVYNPDLEPDPGPVLKHPDPTKKVLIRPGLDPQHCSVHLILVQYILSMYKF